MKSERLILIIDDEPDFIELIRFFLENAKFRVIGVSSGEEGIEKARLVKPDLILLDLNMPMISGHEVCKRLKGNRATLHIPIIMLTVQKRTLDKVEAFNLGVVDYIGKDFSFEEILARIKSVLRERSPEISIQANEERNQKIMELRNVINEKNLKIVFQPIVDLPTRQPIGYEALTRGPKGSFLENPLDLFAWASEADMLLELETLCLNLAMEKSGFVTQSQLLFLNIDPLVINAGYFKDPLFLKDSTIKPSQICIEITERTCIKNFAELSSALSHVKSLGIKVSIDDVGEGYSSLNAVAELKPEFIKVNMNLVRNVNTDSVKNSLIAVIVELAKRLNIDLIAEGIETEEENKTLLSLGIKYGQGFLFAKPCEHP